MVLNLRQFAAFAVLLLFLPSMLFCGEGKDSPSPAAAVSAFPSISLTRIATGLNQPTYIAHAGDGSGRLFIVEKKGAVRIMRNGKILPTPFIDIRRLVKSSGMEQGLFSIAFPPGFKVKGHFYVDYTNRAGIGNTAVARYRVSANPDVADASSGTTVLNVTQPYSNHNGGQLAFGPDGFLYIGLGDGGSEEDPHNNGQKLSTFLGKILRIDVESGVSPYGIPKKNPFHNEIWSYGLRNPWRFSFDRATGDLYIADVGQDLYEEVDFQPAGSRGGENYGWRIMEGLHCFKKKECRKQGLTLPVAEYDHSEGDCSITGGFVYRGKEFPALQGIYLYGDFCSGRIWGLRRNGAAWEKKLLLKTSLQISTFGEDEAGNIYVADFGSGDIYKINAGR